MIAVICRLILKGLYTSKGFWDSYTTIRISSNKNRLDPLFSLSLFHQSTSTCFGHICSLSSGGMLHIYNNWYMLYFSDDCLLARLQICLKHVEVDWRNKLRINNISSWFLLHRYSEMHGEQNIKFRSLQLLTNKCTYITFTYNTLKHLKPLQYISIFSDHHQGVSSFLAKVITYSRCSSFFVAAYNVV